jgi:hypothetical protein
MSRNLDPTLAGGLSAGLIQPVVLVQLTLNSGIERVWSGIGDLVWNGNTFSGVGNLGSIGPIGEGSAVKADGTTVTLSGIGLSQVDVPVLSPTPPDPPVTPPAGQSVAWSYAKTYGPPGRVTIPPSIWNGFEGVAGSADAGPTSGFANLVGGDVFAMPTIGVTWSDFRVPPEIPAGAAITAVYAVASGVVAAIGQLRIAGGAPSWDGTPVNVHTLDQLVGLEVASSLPLSTTSASVGFLGMAVYYEGTPLTKTSLLYEALGDIRVGGPAKIWYGHFKNGAFYGTPYLIFKGTVDKPAIKTSAESNSITIALENRLVNLQRPNARRYTAADQHLYFPTDSAFNFVEILNDMALVWG